MRPPRSPLGSCALHLLRGPVARGLCSAVLPGLVAAALLAPGSAAADRCDMPQRSGCIDADTFWAHAGAARFATIGGTDALPQGEIAFGLVTSLQTRPLVLRSASPGPTGTRTPLIDSQATATFLWAYGFTDRAHLSLAVPATLYQHGEGLRPVTGGAPLRSQSLRDLRFGVGYSFFDRPKLDDATLLRERNVSYGLMGRFDMSAPTGDHDAFASNGTAVFVPSLSGDLRVGRWLFGAELGARLRGVREAVGARVGSQLAVGVGAAFDILRNEALSSFVEARALPSLAEQRQTLLRDTGYERSSSGTGLVPAEWLVGLRTAPAAFGGDLAFDLSGGAALSPDATTPSFRMTLGLRFAPKHRDSDGDGILDKVDKCPHLYEAPIPAGRTDAVRDGCPDPPPKPLDFVDGAQAL